MPQASDEKGLDLFPQVEVKVDRENLPIGQKETQASLEEIERGRIKEMVEKAQKDKGVVEVVKHNEEKEVRTVKKEEHGKLDEKEISDVEEDLKLIEKKFGEIIEGGQGASIMQYLEKLQQRAASSNPELAERLKRKSNELDMAMKAPKQGGLKPAEVAPAADGKNLGRAGREVDGVATGASPNQDLNQSGTVGDNDKYSKPGYGSTFGLGASSRPKGVVQKPSASYISSGHIVDSSEKDTYTKLVEAAEKEQKEKGSGSRGA